MVFRIVNLNSKFHFNERKNQQMHETKIIFSIKIITVFFFEFRRGRSACLCYASNTGGYDHLFIHRICKLTNCHVEIDRLILNVNMLEIFTTC